MLLSVKEGFFFLKSDRTGFCDITSVQLVTRIVTQNPLNLTIKDRETFQVPVLCQEVTIFFNTVKHFGMNLKGSLSQSICNSLHVPF